MSRWRFHCKSIMFKNYCNGGRIGIWNVWWDMANYFLSNTPVEYCPTLSHPESVDCADRVYWSRMQEEPCFGTISKVQSACSSCYDWCPFQLHPPGLRCLGDKQGLARRPPRPVRGPTRSAHQLCGPLGLVLSHGGLTRQLPPAAAVAESCVRTSNSPSLLGAFSAHDPLSDLIDTVYNGT